jgi:hypothetical protein
VGLAPRVEGADVGIVLQRMPVAGDGEIRVHADGVPGQVVPGVDSGHGVARTDLAGQPEAVDRVDNRPRVHEGLERRVLDHAAELPEVLALEEERSFLLVVVGVAEVDVDLAGVGLDLAEVGIPGPVEDEVGREADLGRKAGNVPGRRFVGLDQPAASGVIDVPVGDRGQDLDDPFIVESGELKGLVLTQDAPLVGVDRRLSRLLRGPGEEAEEHGPHGQDLLVREAEALERDAGLNRPALVDDPTHAVPDHVEAGVDVSLDVHHAVLLNTLGVEHEGKTALLVVEGVDDESDDVVRIDPVALAQGGLDFRRFGVVTANGEVEVVRVVSQEGPGSLARVLVDVGFERLPGVEREGRGPDGVVQDPVDDGGDIDPGQGRGAGSRGQGGAESWAFALRRQPRPGRQGETGRGQGETQGAAKGRGRRPGTRRSAQELGAAHRHLSFTR